MHMETMTLTDDDLSETDRDVLAVLADGRVTPHFLGEQVGITREYASQKLNRFIEHDVVVKRAPGLYELVEDPREED